MQVFFGPPNWTPRPDLTKVSKRSQRGLKGPNWYKRVLGIAILCAGSCSSLPPVSHLWERSQTSSLSGSTGFPVIVSKSTTGNEATMAFMLLPELLPSIASVWQRGILPTHPSTILLPAFIHFTFSYNSNTSRERATTLQP